MAWNDGLEPGTQAYNIAGSDNSRIRVVAGPGTGKSFAMKRRVARLLEKGVAPNTILPVTFTRVAAEDLHRELVGMETPHADELNGTTLHSLALKFLSRNHVLDSTNRHPRPLNDFELEPLYADLHAHGGKRELKKKILAYHAAWARLQEDDPADVEQYRDTEFENSLVSWLKFHRGMLIGEVIPYLYQYLRDNPHCEERGEYSHILVDEFQDLNKEVMKSIGRHLQRLKRPHCLKSSRCYQTMRTFVSLEMTTNRFIVLNLLTQMEYKIGVIRIKVRMIWSLLIAGDV